MALPDSIPLAAWILLGNQEAPPFLAQASTRIPMLPQELLLLEGTFMMELLNSLAEGQSSSVAHTMEASIADLPHAFGGVPSPAGKLGPQSLDCSPERCAAVQMQVPGTRHAPPSQPELTLPTVTSWEAGPGSCCMPPGKGEGTNLLKQAEEEFECCGGAPLTSLAGGSSCDELRALGCLLDDVGWQCRADRLAVQSHLSQRSSSCA
jgi:hypothetical protein